MIIRKASRPSFTVIDNRALDDERLTYKALGLLVYVLRQPDNWETNYRHLASRHADGETAVRSALKELESHGYIERRRERGEGGKFSWVQVIYEVPDHAAVSHARETAMRETAMRETAPVISTEVATTEKASTKDVAPAVQSPAVREPRATDDPVKRYAHALTVRAFEMDSKPVVRGDGKGAFPAVMAIFERLLRAGTTVQALAEAVEGEFITVWTIAGVQTAVAQAGPRRSKGAAARSRDLREQGLDPKAVSADADELTRRMFGPGDSSDSALTSDVIDVESRGA